MTAVSRLKRRGKPGRCPTCGRPLVFYIKHPTDKDTLMMGCKKGHRFKRYIPDLPEVTA